MMSGGEEGKPAIAKKKKLINNSTRPFNLFWLDYLWTP